MYYRSRMFTWAISRESGEHSLSMLLVRSLWAFEFCRSFIEVLRGRLCSRFSTLLRIWNKHSKCQRMPVKIKEQRQIQSDMQDQQKLVSAGVGSAVYLGDMWFWDSVLQSLPTVLVIRSGLTSQLLTSPGPPPLSSFSGSWSKWEHLQNGAGRGKRTFMKIRRNPT